MHVHSCKPTWVAADIVIFTPSWMTFWNTHGVKTMSIGRAITWPHNEDVPTHFVSLTPTAAYLPQFLQDCAKILFEAVQNTLSLPLRKWAPTRPIPFARAASKRGFGGRALWHIPPPPKSYDTHDDKIGDRNLSSAELKARQKTFK